MLDPFILVIVYLFHNWLYFNFLSDVLISFVEMSFTNLPAYFREKLDAWTAQPVWTQWW
jgi:hypothetical protein